LSRSGGKSGRRPLLATGRVVEDYEPLLRYFEVAKEKGLKPEAYTITRGDLDYVARLVEEKKSMLELIEELKKVFKGRIDCKTAVEALAQSKGVKLDESQACDYMAFLYAGWLVEACEALGLIKVKEGWRPG